MSNLQIKPKYNGLNKVISPLQSCPLSEEKLIIPKKMKVQRHESPLKRSGKRKRRRKRRRRRRRRFFKKLGKGIKKGIKKTTRGIRKGIETAVNAVTTVVRAVVEPIESVFSWVGSFGGYILSLVVAIPVLGRLASWGLTIFKEVFWRIVGLPDFFATLIGIMPQKKMSVYAVVLINKDREAMATEQEVIQGLNTIIDIFRQRANVKVLPVKPFRKEGYSSFSETKNATSNWFHIMGTPSEDDILNVGCNQKAFGEDLWIKGSKFEFLMNTEVFYGNFRRLTGYGAPIVIFVVNTVAGSPTRGCSIPVVDYVVVGGRSIDVDVVAHECGHSCLLWHVKKKKKKNNLMFSPGPERTGTELSRWQLAILRSSRHVTYF